MFWTNVSWLNFWSIKLWKPFIMWRHVGFPCFLLPSRFWLSTRPWWFRCFKNKCQINLPKWIWSYFVILRFFWVLLASFLCWNVFKVFLSLLKLDMTLFVILLLSSKVVKGFLSNVLWWASKLHWYGHNDFDWFMDIAHGPLWNMFYIMFGLLNHLQGLNMQHFSFMGGVICYINTTH
jgi:hypothetical protein